MSTLKNTPTEQKSYFSITTKGLITVLTALAITIFGLGINNPLVFFVGLIVDFLFLIFILQTFKLRHEAVEITPKFLNNQIKAKSFLVLQVKLTKKRKSDKEIKGLVDLIYSEGLFPITPTARFVKIVRGSVIQNFLFYPAKRGKEKIYEIRFQQYGLFNFFTLLSSVKIKENIFVLPEPQRVSLPWTMKQKIMEHFISEISIPVRGKGMDFLSLKEFEFGDEIRHIHWRATAKFQKLISKEFQEPKQLRFLIIVDSNHYMAGSKLEFALSSVVELMSVLRKFHHRYYIMIHNEDTSKFFSMGNTTQSLLTLQLNLYDVESEGLEFNYKTLRKSILSKKLIDTVIIIISDLEKPPEKLEKDLLQIKSLWNQLFYFALNTPGFGTLAVTKTREKSQYKIEDVYYRRYAVEEPLKLQYKRRAEEYRKIIQSAGGSFTEVETYETNILLELEKLLSKKQKALSSRGEMFSSVDRIENISLEEILGEEQTKTPKILGIPNFPLFKTNSNNNKSGKKPARLNSYSSDYNKKQPK